MKRILFALAFILPALVSCEKENGKEGGKDADPADKFVGTYSYVWNYYEKWCFLRGCGFVFDADGLHIALPSDECESYKNID